MNENYKYAIAVPGVTKHNKLMSVGYKVHKIEKITEYPNGDIRGIHCTSYIDYGKKNKIPVEDITSGGVIKNIQDRPQEVTSWDGTIRYAVFETELEAIAYKTAAVATAFKYAKTKIERSLELLNNQNARVSKEISHVVDTFPQAFL